ncbi:MAG: hypothetical protein M1274_12845 [Actinobacteria bacterium]|nr:hypothetical protein [Actinomycetota bacterium]
MKCIRLFSDEAGNSQFEEVDIPLHQAVFSSPTPPMELSEPQPAERAVLASIPVGWMGERHSAPRRQFFVQMSGTIEVEVAGGRRVVTGPGELTLIEDVDGKGHVTRVIGNVPVTGVFIQLPD